MSLRSLLHSVRARVLLALIAAALVTAALPPVAAASEPVAELLTGTAWSTDVDASGSTGLNDFAIFTCAFLGNTCPICPYTNCHPGPPDPDCESTCPEIFPPCFCGSGVPAWKCNFTCEPVPQVGLSDFSIMTVSFLTGTTSIGKCP